MKKILVLLSAVTVLISCNKAGDNEFIITGKVKGLENGKIVILQKQNEMGQLTPIDTAKVENEKFTFKGSAKEPEIHLIQIGVAPQKVFFILENGDIDMTINKDSIGVTKVTGTYNNEEMNTIRDKSLKVRNDMEKFAKTNQDKMKEAQQKGDTVVINSLNKQYIQFNKDYIKYSEDYIATHPKSFMAALITESLFQNPTPEIEKIKKYYNSFDKSIQNTKVGKSIKTKLDAFSKMATPGLTPLPTASVEVGAMAPDFSAKTPEGKVVSLKESLGKLTVVDFWASWCGPCRGENPNVVALYKEFHAKGLNIIGVSLDDKAADWKAAIAKDGLTWTEVSNLKKWEDPIVAQYHIEGIPATFLLDESGKIIAKDLRGAALREKVASLLKV